MLDPFLNWGNLAELLHAAKFKGICNFPPLPDFDGEEERALFASEYSFEKEMTRSKIMRGMRSKCSSHIRMTSSTNLQGNCWQGVMVAFAT